jgi:hypothetical protein
MKDDVLARLEAVVQKQHDFQVGVLRKEHFLCLCALARGRADFHHVPIFEDVRAKARAVLRSKFGYDWKTGKAIKEKSAECVDV